jgi:hypothetical protein
MTTTIDDSERSVPVRLWTGHDLKQTTAFRKQLQADMVAAREKRLQEA